MGEIMTCPHCKKVKSYMWAHFRGYGDNVSFSVLTGKPTVDWDWRTDCKCPECKKEFYVLTYNNGNLAHTVDDVHVYFNLIPDLSERPPKIGDIVHLVIDGYLSGCKTATHDVEWEYEVEDIKVVNVVDRRSMTPKKKYIQLTLNPWCLKTVMLWFP